MARAGAGRGQRHKLDGPVGQADHREPAAGVERQAERLVPGVGRHVDLPPLALAHRRTVWSIPAVTTRCPSHQAAPVTGPSCPASFWTDDPARPSRLGRPVLPGRDDPLPVRGPADGRDGPRVGLHRLTSLRPFRSQVHTRPSDRPNAANLMSGAMATAVTVAFGSTSSVCSRPLVFGFHQRTAPSVVPVRTKLRVRGGGQAADAAAGVLEGGPHLAAGTSYTTASPPSQKTASRSSLHNTTATPGDPSSVELAVLAPLAGRVLQHVLVVADAQDRFTATG